MRRGSVIEQRSGAAGPQPRPLFPCYWASLHLPGALRVLRAREPESELSGAGPSEPSAASREAGS